MSRTDWMPYNRQGQIDMAEAWLAHLNGPFDGTQDAPARYKAWGLSGGEMEQLRELYGKAEEALSYAKNRETRTEVANKACETSFKTLTAFMRNVKKRRFYIPPLTEADFTALGLHVPDSTRTETGDPTAQILLRPYPSGGFHEIGAAVEFVKGDSADPANKEYRYYYKVAAVGEKPPARPEDLGESFSTKRKKEVIVFDFDDSGKTVYFAARIENGKKKGPWGPMTSAIIP